MKHLTKLFKCPTCGKEFLDWPSQPRKYCSHPCSIAGTTISPAERFWKRVEKTDGCWMWMGKKNRLGYGVLRINGVDTFAHRFSFTVNVGTIPEGKYVLHHCDNPSCVRPDHLFVGTIADNNNDMRSKRRHAFGSKHGLAKLTEIEVQRIKELAGIGMPATAIQATIGKIGISQVKRIIHGSRWNIDQVKSSPKI